MINDELLAIRMSGSWAAREAIRLYREGVMHIDCQCWETPIAYRVRYKGLAKWHWEVAYGHSSWPSRCIWMVPGTFGYL